MNVCTCPCQKISCLHVVSVCTCVGTRVVKATPTTDEKMSTKVEIGVMQKFLVTEVTEAGRNIFVQLDTPEAYQVQDLPRGIETHISKVKDTLSTFEPGTRCYARASDGVLYRALIVNRKTSLSATVYFTDYGNSETVEMSSVYPPTGDYFTLPSQALCCLLGDFVPNHRRDLRHSHGETGQPGSVWGFQVKELGATPLSERRPTGQGGVPVLQRDPLSGVHAYIIFSCLYDPFWVKNDIGTGIHMIIHYNCTIGSFLLHSFLLIYHPYPPSFHEMIFTLVPLIFLS